MDTPIDLSRFTYDALEDMLNGHRKLADYYLNCGQWPLARYHRGVATSITIELGARDARTLLLEGCQLSLDSRPAAG